MKDANPIKTDIDLSASFDYRVYHPLRPTQDGTSWGGLGYDPDDQKRYHDLTGDALLVVID